MIRKDELYGAFSEYGIMYVRAQRLVDVGVFGFHGCKELKEISFGELLRVGTCGFCASGLNIVNVERMMSIGSMVFFTTGANILYCEAYEPSLTEYWCIYKESGWITSTVRRAVDSTRDVGMTGEYRDEYDALVNASL